MSSCSLMTSSSSDFFSSLMMCGVVYFTIRGMLDFFRTLVLPEINFLIKNWSFKRASSSWDQFSALFPIFLPIIFDLLTKFNQKQEQATKEQTRYGFDYKSTPADQGFYKTKDFDLSDVNIQNLFSKCPFFDQKTTTNQTSDPVSTKTTPVSATKDDPLSTNAAPSASVSDAESVSVCDH